MGNIMIVIEGAGRANRGEAKVLAALKGLSGVAVANLLLPGRRTLEVDTVLVTPYGLATIEAKSTKLAGPLVAQANGDWTVGGVRADFPSGANPTVQGRNQAQVAAKLLQERGIAVPRVISFIVVTGNGVTQPSGWVKVNADVVATTAGNLPKALAAVMAEESARAVRQRKVAGPTPLIQGSADAALRTLGVPAEKVPAAVALAVEGFPDRYAPAAPPRPSPTPRATSTSGVVRSHRQQLPLKAQAGIVVVVLLLGWLAARGLNRHLTDLHVQAEVEVLAEKVGAQCGSRPRLPMTLEHWANTARTWTTPMTCDSRRVATMAQRQQALREVGVHAPGYSWYAANQDHYVPAAAEPLFDRVGAAESPWAAVGHRGDVVLVVQLPYRPDASGPETVWVSGYSDSELSDEAQSVSH